MATVVPITPMPADRAIAEMAPGPRSETESVVCNI